VTLEHIPLTTVSSLIWQLLEKSASLSHIDNAIMPSVGRFMRQLQSLEEILETHTVQDFLNFVLTHYEDFWPNTLTNPDTITHDGLRLLSLSNSNGEEYSLIAMPFVTGESVSEEDWALGVTRAKDTLVITTHHMNTLDDGAIGRAQPALPHTRLEALWSE